MPGLFNSCPSRFSLGDRQRPIEADFVSRSWLARANDRKEDSKTKKKVGILHVVWDDLHFDAPAGQVHEASHHRPTHFIASRLHIENIMDRAHAGEQSVVNMVY
jgi:hypothetical protein